MANTPSFPFYPGDWKKDPNLAKCSLATKGAWIELLGSIHETGKGYITGSPEELARLCGCTHNEMITALKELKRHKAANVTVTLGYKNVTVINRRMKRKAQENENARLRMKKHRSKSVVTKCVTQPLQGCTPTPSFSSSLNTNTNTNTPPTPTTKNSARVPVVGDPTYQELLSRAKSHIAYLNRQCGTNYKPVNNYDPMLKDIMERMTEGATDNECQSVIDKKRIDPYFQKNPNLLNPRTLFGKDKFSVYLGQANTIIDCEAKSDGDEYTETEEPDARGGTMKVRKYRDGREDIATTDERGYPCTMGRGAYQIMIEQWEIGNENE